MKYSISIEINLRRTRVIELFDSLEHLKKWQPTLVSTEDLAGVPGQEAATMALVDTMGKREIRMVETLTLRDLPDRFAGIYGPHVIEANLADPDFFFARRSAGRLGNTQRPTPRGCPRV